jgi:Putative auto-transporter adhesin, head GIN domain
MYQEYKLLNQLTKVSIAMKKLLLIITVLVFSTGAQAQKINDANAEKRNVSGYHAVEVSGGIDLYLSEGEESVAISASETKHRDRIKTEVKNGVLKIWYEYNSNVKIDWGNRKMKAYVSYKILDKLRASGGSDVLVYGAIKSPSLKVDVSGGSDFEGKVEANNLTIGASGGSDVRISGTAKQLGIDASGGSDFKGYELAADICNLQASGGSDVYITINKELIADASGGSDVHYKGAGLIREIKSSGSSSIKKVSR